MTAKLAVLFCWEYYKECLSGRRTGIPEKNGRALQERCVVRPSVRLLHAIASSFLILRLVVPMGYWNMARGVARNMKGTG